MSRPVRLTDRCGGMQIRPQLPPAIRGRITDNRRHDTVEVHEATMIVRPLFQWNPLILAHEGVVNLRAWGVACAPSDLEPVGSRPVPTAIRIAASVLGRAIV